MYVDNLRVGESEYKNGFSCVEWPLSETYRVHMPPELLDDVDVWVHEFSEITLDRLFHRGFRSWTAITVSLLNREVLAKVSHVAVSFDLVSMIGKRRVPPGELENLIKFKEETK